MSPKKFQKTYQILVELLEKLKAQPEFKTKKLAVGNLEHDIDLLNNVTRKDTARHAFEWIAAEGLQHGYVLAKTYDVPEEARLILLEMSNISVIALGRVDVD